MLDGLTWREIGVWGTVAIIAVIYFRKEIVSGIAGAWRSLVNGLWRAYSDHAKSLHDTREFSQEMEENRFGNRAQTESAKILREQYRDENAFRVISRLLDSAENDRKETNRALQEIVGILASIQRDQKEINDSIARNQKITADNLRLLWGTIAEIKDSPK